MKERWVNLVEVAAREFPALSEEEKIEHDLVFRSVADIARIAGDTVFLALAAYVLSKWDGSVVYEVPEPSELN